MGSKESLWKVFYAMTYLVRETNKRLLLYRPSLSH